MFATSSSSDATDMAWNWVIQSIAKFKKVDPFTLTGLVDDAPETSVDMRKDAKEIASLRILESLFLQGNDATVDSDSGQHAKISIDPSEQCEDVMYKILEETSEPVMEFERQNWNIRPFIIHKNASLPKPTLQKFKEALLEGNHPILESLKEMSKLEGAKVSESIPENENSKLQKSPLQKLNHLEDSNRGFTENIERKEHEMTILPPENDLVDDDDLVFLRNENENSKLQERRLQKPNHVEDSNREFTKDIERTEHEMTILPPGNDLVDDNDDDEIDHGQQPPREDDDDNTDHGQQPHLDDDNDNIDHGQQLPGEYDDDYTDHGQLPPREDNDDSVDHGQQPPRKDDDDNVDYGQQPPHEDDNDNVDHGQQPHDDDDVDMTDIAAKKEAFLSSQFTQSQDFVSTVDFTETYLCMKCNKSGKLLVCNSDVCPFRVHERCLSTFDEKEAFFCPFCSYSHAISKYMEVKKKASFARKDLQAFLTSRVKHTPNISSKTDENIKLNGGERVISRDKDCAPVDSVHRSTCQADVAKQSSEDKESPVSSTSSHSKRARKREPRTSTTLLLPRRRNLFWEKSEEEKLKEGMQKFYSEDNKRVPWKKILDFGRDVFDERLET